MLRSIKIALLVLCLLSLLACRFELRSDKIRIGDEIDPGERERIEQLTRTLLDTLRNGTTEEVVALFHPAVREKPGFHQNTRRFHLVVQDYMSKGKLGQGFEDLQTYQFNRIGGGMLPMVARPKEPLPHTMTTDPGPYSGAGHLVTIPSDVSAAEHALVVLSILDDDRYHVMIGHLGLHSLGGKNGPEWYAAALRGEDTDPIAATWWRCFAAAQTFQPIPQMRYDAILDFEKFYIEKKQELESRWTFPIEVDELPNNISVVGFEMLQGDDGLVPAVSYASDLLLTDDAALEAQAAELLVWAENEFGGFCSADTEAIMFLAFEEMPLDQSRGYDRHGTRVDCPNYVPRDQR
ncbi:hypothetical protein ABI59_07140 [Acidobacteria bacterium Mor1]|nr:hypothetical protein ABI59_07140 [Acidobacteria bacterium Mor1]